jgi:hypothetical protein
MLADTLEVSAEALRVTAESAEGGAVGMRSLLESLLQGDQMPAVEVPIGVDLPNPVLPFVLPAIHVDITQVSVPASVIAGVVTTLVFDAAGVGQLVRALDDTASTLHATRAALQTVRKAIVAGSATRMRAALAASRPTAPLSVEIVGPQPGTAAAATGEFVFRIPGATWSFVDPAGEGLPAEAVSRIRVLVDGRIVPLSDIEWWDYGVAMEGHLRYAAQGSLLVAGDRPPLTVPAGPVALLVLVTDATGTMSAHAAWHVVVPARSLSVGTPERWYPIARRAPFVGMTGIPEVAMPTASLLERRDRRGRIAVLPTTLSPRG